MTKQVTIVVAAMTIIPGRCVNLSSVGERSETSKIIRYRRIAFC